MKSGEFHAFGRNVGQLRHFDGHGQVRSLKAAGA
jgi:hypothetical protein